MDRNREEIDSKIFTFKGREIIALKGLQSELAQVIFEALTQGIYTWLNDCKRIVHVAEL